MKELIVLAEIMIATSISFNLSAQQIQLIQKLPLLNPAEFIAVEKNLPLDVKRETLTGTAGQYSVIILSGYNNINKQNTARYMAQKKGSEIYKVSLSLLVEKNILQTKKNFDIVFEAVKNTNVVLLFDEGEVLFGDRRSVQDAHDRYNSEETNYFFDRVEKYRCPVIISTSEDTSPYIFERYIRFRIF